MKVTPKTAFVRAIGEPFCLLASLLLYKLSAEFQLLIRNNHKSGAMSFPHYIHSNVEWESRLRFTVSVIIEIQRFGEPIAIDAQPKVAVGTEAATVPGNKESSNEFLLITASENLY